MMTFRIESPHSHDNFLLPQGLDLAAQVHESAEATRRSESYYVPGLRLHLFKVAAAMKNGDDQDAVGFGPVDDPIMTEEKFADSVFIGLGYSTADKRKVLEYFRGCNDPFDKTDRILF